MNTETERNNSVWQILGLILAPMRKSTGRVKRAGVVCVVLMLGSASLNAFAPTALAHAVDALGEEAIGPSAWGGVALIGLYAALLWLGKSFSELQWSAYSPIEQYMSRCLSLEVFKTLQAKTYSYHVTASPGALSQIVTRGTAAAKDILLNSCYFIIPIGVEIALVCGILFVATTPLFATIIALCTVFYAWLVVHNTEELKIFSRKTNAENTAAHKIAFDGIANFETVKYFSAESWLQDRLRNRLAAVEQNANTRQSWRAWYGFSQWSVLAATAAILMMLAAWNVTQGRMTVGDVVLVNAYVLRIVRPLSNFGRIYRVIRLALIDIEKLAEVMAVKEREDLHTGDPLPDGLGHITIRQLSFSYGNQVDILSAIDLEINARECVAIVGPSGSGKTTLTRLVFRFFEPQSGTIEIDGSAYTSLSRQAVRDAIAVVPQDPVLFNETLRDNLLLARPKASEQELEEAINISQLSPTIARLPLGMETYVGDRGKALSGGERQRIAIARALLKRPRILILDEATSALDTHTENALLSALDGLRGQITTLVIAHRLSTIMNADRVVVLENGKIIENGTPNELKNAEGPFASLWRNQSVQAASQ